MEIRDDLLFLENATPEVGLALKPRARFYKLVASVYGTFASRVSRCRRFDYKRGGGYTP